MPFSLGFKIYPWVEQLLRVRKSFFLSYGLALAMVASAVFVRWLVSEYVGPRVPYITFYPAIILAALIGGLGPGILATVLSTTAAWYLFMPPEFGLQLSPQEVAHLGLFLFISSVNVAIAVVINVLVDRLIIQQRNIRLLLDSAPNGFLLVDSAGRIRLANASTGKLFGYTSEELAGKSVELLVPEENKETHGAVRSSYQKHPEVRAMGLGRDLSGRRKDGSKFSVEIGLSPVEQSGQSAVLASVIDISMRKQAEESQRLVVSELQHRTRNLFAVIQALIANSVDRETASVLMGRVRSLAEAHRLLTDVEGAPLAKIISSQLAAHSGRVSLDGCSDIAITSRAAQQFALILHELATNALKYGALSKSGGHVAIAGNVDRVNGGQLVFLWQEKGGPPVAPPTRRGFGSVILQNMAEEFAERVIVEYRPDGLRYELHIELGKIEVAGNPRPHVNAPIVRHSGLG